jgi:dUTPase
MRGMSIGTQRGGVANERDYLNAISRTAKQALRYLLWKQDQVAIAEDTINSEFIIPIKDLERDRVHELLEEIARLPINAPTTTSTATLSDSSQSIQYNPLYNAMNQSGDSLGVTNPTRNTHPWDNLENNSNPHYTNTPPFTSQPPPNNNHNLFGLGASMGYIGATLANTTSPNQFQLQTIDHTLPNNISKRKYRKLNYTYNGEGEIEAFTFITNYHFATYRDNWSDQDKVAYFPNHLLGKALQWYKFQYAIQPIDFITLKQAFLKTFASRQNPLYYTSRLCQKVSAPFASIQAYISKFEEIMITTPRDMIANHDAIQIFLMNLPESFKMELTLQPCDNIKKLIETAKFIIDNRNFYLGKELATQQPRSNNLKALNVTKNNQTNYTTNAKGKNAARNSKLTGKYCNYHKSRTHSDDECFIQHPELKNKTSEHNIDIDTKVPIEVPTEVPVVKHVGLNIETPAPLPQSVTPILSEQDLQFIWTTASAATITVTIDKIPITAILDTGCAGVTLSTRILQKIQQQPEQIPPTSVSTAERHVSTTLGFKKFTFRIGQELIHCPALVLPSNSYDMLLSTNILGYLNAQIDFKKSILSLPNGKIPFNWSPLKNKQITTAYIAPMQQQTNLQRNSIYVGQINNSKVVKYFQLYPQLNTAYSEATAILGVNAAHPVKLEPHQQLKVETGLALDIPNGISGIIFNHHWSTQMGLTIVPGTLYPQNYTSLAVLIVNNTKHTIEIPPGQRIGSI